MTARSEVPTNSGWVVTGQTEQTQIGTAGNFVPGFAITFRTTLGHTGSVFVENNLYNPDNVRAAINLRADAMDTVGTLRSDG